MPHKNPKMRHHGKWNVVLVKRPPMRSGWVFIQSLQTVLTFHLSFCVFSLRKWYSINLPNTCCSACLFEQCVKQCSCSLLTFLGRLWENVRLETLRRHVAGLSRTKGRQLACLNNGPHALLGFVNSATFKCSRDGLCRFSIEVRG